MSFAGYGATDVNFGGGVDLGVVGGDVVTGGEVATGAADCDYC
jgi:hypothetical protein